MLSNSTCSVDSALWRFHLPQRKIEKVSCRSIILIRLRTASWNTINSYFIELEETDFLDDIKALYGVSLSSSSFECHCMLEWSVSKWREAMLDNKGNYIIGRQFSKSSSYVIFVHRFIDFFLLITVSPFSDSLMLKVAYDLCFPSIAIARCFIIEISRLRSARSNWSRGGFCEQRVFARAALCLLQFNFLHYMKSPAFHHRATAPRDFTSLWNEFLVIYVFAPAYNYATLNVEPRAGRFLPADICFSWISLLLLSNASIFSVSNFTNEQSQCTVASLRFRLLEVLTISAATFLK